VPLQIGDRVSRRYRLLEPIGQGGMASVFLAEDEPRRARVVLKELRRERPELLESFRAEFALLATLTHPNISAVHDFGSERLRGELVHYYTAEWIDGVTLAVVAERGGDVLAPLADALAGLASLHALGVTHGDFTPHNVLVRQDGSGTLIDLGCARPAGLTSDSVSGTPGYLAPELLATGVSSVASDLYAVGVTLGALQGLQGERPRAALVELVRRLTAAEPRERPASAEVVLEALGARHARRAQALPVRSLELVGRERERAAFAAWLAALLERRPGERVLALAGRRGAGKTRLVRELGASAALALPVLRAEARDTAPVQWLLSAATGSSEPFSGVRGALAAAERLAARREPLLLVLEDVDRLEGDQASLLAQFARSLGPEAPVALLVSGTDPLPGLACERLELSPLDAGALGRWTREGLSPRRLLELARESEGLPARVEQALERLSGSLRSSSEPAPVALEQELAGLGGEQRARLALVVALGELEPSEWGLTGSDFAFALERGLCTRDRTRLAPSALVDPRALEQALGVLVLEARRRVAAELGAGACPTLSPPAREAEIVRQLALGERARDAAERLASAEPLWRAAPAAFLARLSGIDRRALPDEFLLTLAEVALAGAEPRLALGLAARALRRRPGLRARLLGAEARLRLGRGARAARALRRLLEGDADDAERRRGGPRLAPAPGPKGG
jgi:hypothetical protein